MSKVCQNLKMCPKSSHYAKLCSHLFAYHYAQKLCQCNSPRPNYPSWLEVLKLSFRTFQRKEQFDANFRWNLCRLEVTHLHTHILSYTVVTIHMHSHSHTHTLCHTHSHTHTLCHTHSHNRMVSIHTRAHFRRPKTDYSKQSFEYSITKLWNTLPPSIRMLNAPVPFVKACNIVLIRG